MIPKKIYLNYVDESDPDKTWSEEPVLVCDCKMKNREYTDLSQIWHDASEEPRCDELLLGEDTDGFSIYRWCGQEDKLEAFVNKTGLSRGAYIEELLPKVCK